MPRSRVTRLSASTITAVMLAACGTEVPRAVDKMSFFVTSVQAGDGGNIGGLDAADAHCAKLAAAVGSPKRQWRAYLSAADSPGRPHVHARDRIGVGPWVNADGVQVAASVIDLHGAGNHLGQATSLDEHGRQIGFFHDMLTGSNSDGTLAEGDTTCRNWTSTQGHAIVGHPNKGGTYGGERATSWNSAHETRGCSLPALKAMGGAGLFYCFALD